MSDLDHLFEKNRNWVREITSNDPDFFKRLAGQQSPELLWIGCSDSRVPANDIVGLLPGELFVHRNVANLVLHTDFNCLSVIQFAVDVLKVKHVIVCGHYGCGGVGAIVTEGRFGLVDNWVRTIREVYLRNMDELQKLTNQEARINRMCEINVVQQVENLRTTTVIRDAWDRGQSVTLHGWIYDVADGLLKDLKVSDGP